MPEKLAVPVSTSPAMTDHKNNAPATMTAPWYARAVSAVGRPAVLLAALAMSAPGEYRLAVLAGWSGWVAALMPLFAFRCTPPLLRSWPRPARPVHLAAGQRSSAQAPP